MWERKGRHWQWQAHGRYAEQRDRLKDRVPYIAVEHTPDGPAPDEGLTEVFTVATYNVHRWTGFRGGNAWQPELATDVIAELGTDVIALQEVLRPFDAPDPLTALAHDLGLHLTFVTTRIHRHGELGNAVLSRWPMEEVFTIDLSMSSRLEQRSAVVTRFNGKQQHLAVVATHLALVDRTRHRQVHELLDYPALQGPVVLLGDMNAWRRCRATRTLDREFRTLHHNLDWPPTFPANRPVLALDRIYARGARVRSVAAHATDAARRASDHLPVVATVELDADGSS